MRLNLTATVVAVGLCLLVAGVKSAVTDRWQVSLLRGSTTLEQVSGTTQVEAWDKCAARVRSLSETANANTVFICQTLRYYGTTITPPVRSASLAWQPPTRNTDGSALTNLAGYRISYGTSPTALVQTVQLSNAGASSYVISNLSPATWYFAVRAYTTDGTESADSNVGSKVIL